MARDVARGSRHDPSPAGVALSTYLPASVSGHLGVGLPAACSGFSSVLSNTVAALERARWGQKEIKEPLLIGCTLLPQEPHLLL